MLAVIFEVWPTAEGKEEYLEIAANLRTFLEDRDGFISIDRYQSLNDEDKILSLSFWRDEEAVKQWRTFEPHRSVQKSGRQDIFADYRLRVASVIRDYGMNDRREAPRDSLDVHPS